MSQKSEHTRYEEIILGRISCEEAPQVVPACRHSFITWPFFDPGSGVGAHVSVGASGGSCRIETTQKGEKYVRVAALMQLNCCNIAVSILLQLNSYTATLQFQQWCTVAVLMQFDSPLCDPIPSRDPGNQVGQPWIKPWLFQPEVPSAASDCKSR